MSNNESLPASSLESSKKEQFNDEITQFKTAIDSNPNDVENRVKLAVAFRREKNDINLAVSLLEEAIKINPNHAEAHYQLGFILCQEKERVRTISTTWLTRSLLN